MSVTNALPRHPRCKRGRVGGVNASINGKDTVFVNNIAYNFNPFFNGKNKVQYVLYFSFLKKYGSQKLVGVHIKTNPLSAGNSKPTIPPIDKFSFDLSDIKRFRIYYDEGKDRKTKFNKETGYFAIEGDLSTIENQDLPLLFEICF